MEGFAPGMILGGLLVSGFLVATGTTYPKGLEQGCVAADKTRVVVDSNRRCLTKEQAQTVKP